MSQRSHNTTYADVQQMLTDGGYLRARIQTLTPFDKVAGGLAWGIRNSRFSIDVEFVENAVIRDKIRISENICAALKSDMQCPHDLEPHQIQGLDYPNIAVVLRWLLKRVAAAREENEHFVNEHTKLEFRRHFGIDLVAFDRRRPTPTGIPPVSRTRRPIAVAAPERVMISSADASRSNPLEHVSGVLLEYGERYQIKDSALYAQDAELLAEDAEMQREKAKLEDDERAEAAMLDSLLTHMSGIKEKARMSAAGIDSVLAVTNTDKLAKARGVYEARKQALVERMQKEEEKRNQLEHQRTRLEELRVEVQQAQSSLQETQQQIVTTGEEFAKEGEHHEKKCTNARAELSRIEELERVLRSDEQRSTALDGLFSLVESRKAVEQRIQRDAAEIKEQIAATKEECQRLADEIESFATAEGAEKFHEELTVLEKARQTLSEELAEATREAMSLLRSYDEYPTRQELQQYELRLNELNEEVAWKFEVTRLMYTQYNTKVEVVKCLESEGGILESVGSAFEQCTSSKKNVAENKSSLLDQAMSIVRQLTNSRAQQDTKLEKEKEALNDKRKTYDTIAEKQKAFTVLVEKLKQAIVLNGQLADQLNALKAPAEEGEQHPAQ